MTVLNTITMDLLQLSRPRVNVVAGTVDCYQLALCLYEGSTPWEIPAETVVSLRYGKPDGTFGVYDTLTDGTAAWTVQGNRVTVALAPQMLTVAGIVNAQVVLRCGARVLPTFTVEISVQHDPSFEAVTSEDYVNWFAMYEGALAESIARLEENFWQAMESPAYPGCRYVMKDGVVEWVNPPMVVGTEYRTTERWNGKVKYKKLIEYTNAEALSGSMTLNVAHGIADLHMMLTAHCTTSGYLLPYLTAGSSLGLSAWDSRNLVLYGNSSWGAGRKWYIEMCYTKTTD